jgi:hypothetical protein
MELLFVYNADSGAWNTALDMAHKVFSPKTYSCNLCQVTHGIFQEKKEWGTFVDELKAKGVSCLFYHKDEFYKEYPDCKDDLPAVFLREEELTVQVTAEEMNQIHSLQEMIGVIRNIAIK